MWKKIIKFFIRLWFFNRNYELKRSIKHLRKGLAKRDKYWFMITHAGRVEYMKRDKFMKRSYALYTSLKRYFAWYEKHYGKPDNRG